LSGDIVFAGRIPFIGGNAIGHWIDKIDQLTELDAKVVIPGHGQAFTNKNEGVKLTRDYLVLLRKSMGDAIEEMTSFDDAYAATDWGRFVNVPLFDSANRINAYRVYLSLEAKSF
ncbi:MAG: MBL fold metallo-hydrolase, partial [Gammaproteobacteria bacterium]|nr:MBL fold metallo-hydrolase [Gammaproteobacteria bacterium]